VKSRAGFLAGLLAAGLAAWPAALRFEHGLFWQAFLVLLAGAALIMAPLSSALAAAGPPDRFTRALTVGALASALLLVPFATVLKTSTHHRPLGGVTFAVISGFVIIALTVISGRLITWAGEQPSLLRTLARAAIVLLTALGASSVLLGLIHGLKGDPAFRTGFFDALRVKIRDEGLVRNKAVYIALGVQADGTKDILGLWIENTEGAKFWLRVMNELKNRGVSDVLIAVIDGLKGFPEAINAVFPQTIVQTCIVHLIRHSMDFASWKDRKALAGALKTVYRAKDADAANAALTAFDASHWGQKYPAITQSWRRNWERVIPFFAFPEAVRRIIYTTNAIESLNAKLRRAVKIRGHFPNDDAAAKLLFLVLRQAAGQWKMPPREWFEAKTQFAILFGERFVQA